MELDLREQAIAFLEFVIDEISKTPLYSRMVDEGSLIVWKKKVCCVADRNARHMAVGTVGILAYYCLRWLAL